MSPTLSPPPENFNHTLDVGPEKLIRLKVALTRKMQIQSICKCKCLLIALLSADSENAREANRLTKSCYD